MDCLKWMVHLVHVQPTQGHSRRSGWSGQGQTRIRHVPFKLNSILLQKQWESLLKIQ